MVHGKKDNNITGGLFPDNKQEQNDVIQPVLLPLPFSKTFDYKIPSSTPLEVGSYVLVPFGPRQLIGVVWGEAIDNPEVPRHKLKPILEAYDFTPMSEEQRKFIIWAATYTMSTWGHVLKLSISVREALEKPKKITACYLNPKFNSFNQKLTEKRASVVDYLKQQKSAQPTSIVKEVCNVSQAVIKGMVDKKIIKYTMIEPEFEQHFSVSGFKKVELNDAQQKAVDECLEIFEEEDYSVTLLDGVTGSGKTEVYFELIEKQILDKKQSLVLLPEIALTQQILTRFEKRFGQAPVVWHSGLTPAQRRDNWRRIARGDAKVVIGARSALFLPYKNLNLIVIDEEHDPVYKQEEGVMYHARDMAVIRSKFTHSHLLLVSATPSLETVANIEEGKYNVLHLPSRYGVATMPDIHLIDLRQDRPQKGKSISPTLQDVLKKTFERKEQSLLFLNRRGYAPLTLCGDCGYRIACENCSSWMTKHKRFNRLQCHHCGFAMPMPEDCPECGSVDSFTSVGPGVEKMVEEVREILPLAKIVVFSSDNMQDPEILKNTLQQIQKGKFDVLVGTQMLAKGHHFPLLTTVGIIDADSGLSGGDLRASERTFQLLHQVSGRAGRAQKKGHVYIQTRQMDSAIIQALKKGDRDSFVDAELDAREESDMPPFTRLVSIIVSGEEQDYVQSFAKMMAMKAPTSDQYIIYGPAPAILERLRGQYRYRFLVKSAKTFNIQKLIKFWLDHIGNDNKIRIQIDVDPQSFY